MVSLLVVASMISDIHAQTDDRIVVLETTQGNLVIEFFSDAAPKHVTNFVNLTKSGFYDDTVFHRIIPGFMIQGGDPNTVQGDPSTWGTGGPSWGVDAEFNDIMHKRGIVSMARSTSPNSAGSQFFVVHSDSSSLDQKYTVFGRIATTESFNTLDKIAAVSTDTNDRPLDPEQVRLLYAMLTERSAIPDLLGWTEPARSLSTSLQQPSSSSPIVDDQRFESEEYGVAFDIPEGWSLQDLSDAEGSNAIFMAAIGPKTGDLEPAFTLIIRDTHSTSLQDIIDLELEQIKEQIADGTMEILSEKMFSISGKEAHLLNAKGSLARDDIIIPTKFQRVVTYDDGKSYFLTYANDADTFDAQLHLFEETLGSFELLTVSNSDDTYSTNIQDQTSLDALDTTDEDNKSEGGGCLIATATYGSEFAPQVQQLRELRDDKILSTVAGTAFMSEFNRVYYSFSPVVADLERENPVFREAVKVVIMPMLASISLLNHVDINTDAQMLSYGIGVILLIVGIYIVMPIVIAYGAKRAFVSIRNTHHN